jgi:hypothetical protein
LCWSPLTSAGSGAAALAPHAGALPRGSGDAAGAASSPAGRLATWGLWLSLLKLFHSLSTWRRTPGLPPAPLLSSRQSSSTLFFAMAPRGPVQMCI